MAARSQQDVPRRDGWDRARVAVLEDSEGQVWTRPRTMVGRLLPVLGAVVFVAMIDRGLLAFAADGLCTSLNMDTAEYGAVAGAFYLPYALLQFPSLWIASYAGPRRWLAAVLLGVGLATLATAFVQSKAQLAMARIALGAVEGGIFPIMFLVVNNLLREPSITYVWTWLYALIQMSLILAGPFADAINSCFHGVAGLQGWQWMFVFNGILACMCAAAVAALLPAAAREHSMPAEVDAEAKGGEYSASNQQGTGSLLSAFRDWKTAYLSFTQIFAAVPGAAFAYFSPMLIEDLLRAVGTNSTSDHKRTAFLLNAVPYTLAFLSITAVSQTMKATRDRFWHGTTALTVSGCLSLLYPLVNATGATASTFACMCLYYAIYATFSVALDTLPILYCSQGGQNPAAVYCLANSFKAFGEMLGPPSCGYFVQTFGGAAAVAIGGVGFILPTGLLFCAFFYLATPVASPARCRALCLPALVHYAGHVIP